MHMDAMYIYNYMFQAEAAVATTICFMGETTHAPAAFWRVLLPFIGET